MSDPLTLLIIITAPLILARLVLDALRGRRERREFRSDMRKLYGDGAWWWGRR